MSRGEEGNYQSGRERGSVKVGTGGSLVLGLKLGQMLGSYNSNLESAKWKGEKFKIKGWLKTGIGEVCGKYVFIRIPITCTCIFGYLHPNTSAKTPPGWFHHSYIQVLYFLQLPVCTITIL